LLVNIRFEKNLKNFSKIIFSIIRFLRRLDELEDATTKPKAPKIEISQEMLNLISNMPNKKQDVQALSKNEYVRE